MTGSFPNFGTSQSHMQLLFRSDCIHTRHLRVCLLSPPPHFTSFHVQTITQLRSRCGTKSESPFLGKGRERRRLCLCIRPAGVCAAHTELAPGWISASSSRSSVLIASPSTAADCLLFGPSGTHTPNPDSHLRHTHLAARSLHVYVTQACTDQGATKTLWVKISCWRPSSLLLAGISLKWVV